MVLKRKFLISACFLTFSTSLYTQDASIVQRIENLEAAAAQSSADNAWVLICSAMVSLMTVSGLALFCNGLVGQKTRFRQLYKAFCLPESLTVVRTVFGYSLAFPKVRRLSAIRFAR